jgi:hypothetical protein
MPTTYWTQTDLASNRLDPVFDAENAWELPVNLVASKSYARGEVLGESLTVPGTFDIYSGTNALGAAPAAPTLTHPNTGSLAAGVYKVRYKFVTADGREGLPSAEASVTAIANDVVHVAAVTPLPAGATSVKWFMSAGPGDDTLLLALSNDGSAADLGLPPSGAEELGLTTDTTWTATKKATMILRYKCSTDSGGIITLGSGSQEFPQTGLDANAYVHGTFKCEEVHGLNATTLAMLGGRLLYGDFTSGVFTF